MVRTDRHNNDPCRGQSPVMPAVNSAVLDNDVSRIEDDLPSVQLKTYGSLQDDVEVQGGGRVHARTVVVCEWPKGVQDELVELLAITRRKLENGQATTTNRWPRTRPARLLAIIGILRHLVSSPRWIERATASAKAQRWDFCIARDD